MRSANASTEQASKLCKAWTLEDTSFMKLKLPAYFCMTGHIWPTLAMIFSSIHYKKLLDFSFPPPLKCTMLISRRSECGTNFCKICCGGIQVVIRWTSWWSLKFATKILPIKRHTNCELGGMVMSWYMSIMTWMVQIFFSQVTNSQTHPIRWLPNWDHRGEGFFSNKYTGNQFLYWRLSRDPI